MELPSLPRVHVVEWRLIRQFSALRSEAVEPCDNHDDPWTDIET